MNFTERTFFQLCKTSISLIRQINSIFWRLFYYFFDVSPTYSSRLPQGNVFNHV